MLVLSVSFTLGSLWFIDHVSSAFIVFGLIWILISLAPMEYLTKLWVMPIILIGICLGIYLLIQLSGMTDVVERQTVLVIAVIHFLYVGTLSAIKTIGEIKKIV